MSKIQSNNINTISNKLIEIGASDILENLQYHKNEAVYDKVGNILDKYFALD